MYFDKIKRRFLSSFQVCLEMCDGLTIKQINTTLKSLNDDVIRKLKNQLRIYSNEIKVIKN
jgi:hypothetical protein